MAEQPMSEFGSKRCNKPQGSELEVQRRVECPPAPPTAHPIRRIIDDSFVLQRVPIIMVHSQNV